ncbi:MAG: 2-succinyl-5-enolpyruvyl-6-hydroxy-3-cyclohexene-1-carboxylic-acid synthase, partial [Verrucomicrobia bacterium]|nr:2-succinyl-5-enolpyruvyl-6-hydroxy-3-cyclohexene-1-carboxylic-acid synthase [Verrucomicrobiota bacterium]
MIESWMIDALVQQGVVHFCMAPGSRSTPLVSAAVCHPKAKTHVHYDERGLGFLALGLAKGCQKPVAVIVTSGTAVGNLLPAIMEAHHSHTPLILLTADRPHELRDCSANQTCDQVKIFQSFVRWQTDCPTEMDEPFFRSLLAQAYFASMKNPPGPVHVNCPFREPLYKADLRTIEGKPMELVFPRHAIASYRTAHARGAILVGRLPMQGDIHPILRLAKRLQWPVLADVLSNARCTPTEEQMRYFDYNDKPRPDFVLHFGERMTSKKVLQWLTKMRPEIVHVSPRPELQDPERILTGRVQSDIHEFCEGFESGFDPTWFSSWRDEEPAFEETGSWTEAHAMRKIGQILPPGFGIFLGNGMPIRDADHFLFPSEPRSFFANRGLSGIDGNIATLAGLAEEMPMLGIIGDQAALYDLNSLPLLKKAKHPAILLISNNFGGGIFHHLPIAASPHFEQFWANAHDMHFAKAASMFDLPYMSFAEMQFDQTGVV